MRCRFRSLHAAAAVALVLLLTAACRTAPPPPPAPAPVTTHVEAAPAPPPEVVRVTGSTLNVRHDPATTAAVVARVKRGERLTVVAREGGWVRVRLADGTEGWASAKYLRAEQPCPADKADAELLSDVPLSFSEGPSAGKVVIEATVDAGGKVAATKLVSDTTAIPEFVQRAEAEVRALVFSPPVRNCRPVPFLYTYTRSF